MTWRDPFYPGDDLIDAANEAIDLRRTWVDLRERLTRAAEELDALARTEQDEQACVRLRGKRQGVLLALDYMRGYGQ